MHLTFKIMLFSALPAISFTAPGQNSNVKNPFLPNYVVPSAQSSGLGRYGEMPVSPATGLPDINIPLGSAKGNKLEVPVRLLYHASGIKVDDLAGWTGQGWSLDAGGIITRTIVGMPDENNRKNFYCNFCSLQSKYLKSSYDIRNSNDDYSYLQKLAEGTLDGEPDIFMFNFLGKTGKFFIDTSGIIIMDKQYPYKIESAGFKGGEYITWKLTDENGIMYYFGDAAGGVERVKTISSPQSSGPPYGGPSAPQTTSWYLTKIMYPGNMDSVIFTYSDYSRQSSQSPIHKYKTNYYPYHSSISPPITGDFDMYHILKGSIDGQASTMEVFALQFMYLSRTLLSSIRSATGVIKFFSHSVNMKYSDRNADYQLDSISFSDNDNRTFKKYQLFYSYKNERLFLDSLKEKAAGTTIPPYVFSYYADLPKRFSYAQDYWGYYNGKTNTHLIPYVKELTYKVRPFPATNGLESYVGYTPAIRTADELSAKAGTLSKIKYPTGGYTQFDYELNEFSTINQNLDLLSLGLPLNATMKGGGLRIKSIADFDGITTIAYNRRTYEYSGGLLQHVPQYLSVTKENNYHQTNDYQQCLDAGIGAACSDCAGYDTYTTLIYTGYSTPQNLLGITDITNVSYDRVKENFYKGAIIYGYNEYQFDQSNDLDNQITLSSSTFSFPLAKLSQSIPKTGSAYRRGNLIYENQYIKGASGFVLKVSKHSIYDYNDNSSSPRYREINAIRAIQLNAFSYRFNENSTNFGTVPASGCYINMRGSDFGYGFYRIICATPTLRSVQTNYYDDDGSLSLTETNNYYYQNNTHTFPTRVEFTNSKSELIINNMTYPVNYTDQVFKKMVTGNIVAPVIQTDKLSGTTQLESTLNNYVEWAPGFFDKSNILHSYRTATKDAEVTFDVYDKSGNVVQFTSKSGLVTTLLYGYNRQYLIAKIVGATYSQAMGVLALSGTASSDKYEALQAIRNDVFLRNKLAALRNIQNSLANIYTYVPAVGVSSSTDEMGKTTYYTYDEMGRLVLVRDDNMNIVKKYCYGYQGQTASCNIYLQSVAQSGTYTKATCGTGFGGSNVTYTVPAGIYSSTISVSDANLKAQADVAANGQNYANENGTCSAIVNVAIKGYNAKGTDYKIKMVNNATAVIYYFNLPTGTSVAQTLGEVPSGIYTVSFVPNPSPVSSATFNINGVLMTGVSVVFNNMVLTTGVVASMY